MPRLTIYEEKMLLKEVSMGNEKAFRTVYDAYFPRVSAYIFKLCKSGSATEEIVQDIFLKLWMNRAAMDQVENPEAYIFSMARNKTIDYLRMLARETDLIQVLGTHLQTPANDAEEKLNAEGLRTLIEAALEKLSEQKKKIFQLSRNEGLSHDEIAALMHLSKSTVKNHLSETLQQVREHLRKQPNSDALLLLFIVISAP